MSRTQSISKSPLDGVRVVVTRAVEQASSLARTLAEAGAQVESLPLIEVVPPSNPRPLARAASELALYDWVVFTSANGVRALLGQAEGSLPASLSAATVGRATTKALRAHGIEAQLTSEKSDAEGLLAELAPKVAQKRVLLPQAADARPLLAQGLAAAGADVTVVVAYEKRMPPGVSARAAKLFSGGPVGWVTFTSAGLARRFAGLFAEEWESRRLELLAASIGPVTSRELRALGLEPAAEAARPGDAELVAAIVGRVATTRAA
ncbi:MAG TPA: uroporphyrinogen-III synthase [Thermoanaerobaculia bacterium]|nr:uroporphyrinogen-III synthase [Thermoanaerobaculia bacterium]